MNVFSFRRLLTVFLLCAAINTSAIAETPEQVINPKTARNEWVSDMAGVIDADIERQINALVNSLEQKTGAEIAVVTIRRTDGRSPKEFVTALFKHWSIGKKGEDNGILVLLVIEARWVEVETGYGVEGVLTDGKVGEILDKAVIPRFKQGDFGGGLLGGIREIVKVISRETATKTQKEGKSSGFSQGWGILLVIFLFLAAGIGVFLVTGFGFMAKRREIPYCPKCRRKMSLLSEIQKKDYLSDAQKFEESLNSVKYKVWRCEDCQELESFAVIEPNSRYLKCPDCQYYTLSTRISITKEPPPGEHGQEEIRRTCLLKSCNYTHSETKTIPKVKKHYAIWEEISDTGGGGGWSGGGGGGGSFGGGSSGGGGAGRSW